MEDPSMFPVLLLEENIRARKQQLASLGPEHRDYAYLLSGMSDFWLYKSKKTQESSDFAQAVDVARQAVDAMLPTEPDAAPILGRLDALLFERFMASGNKADLEETFRLSDRALKATEVHGAQWMSVRYNFNLRLLQKFKQFGDVGLLDDVVEHSRTLIDLKAKVPCNLSIAELYRTYSLCLCERAKAKGSLVELDEGIAEGYRALDACNESDPDYPVTVSNLAVLVLYRYQSTQLFESLREAMRLSQLAVDTVPEEHAYRPITSLNHGTLLFAFSERVRSSDPALSLSTLEEAISRAREVVEIPSEECKRYTLITALDNLSAWLGLKLKLTGDVSSGKEAVRIAESALQLITPEYRERPTVLNNLVCSLDALYEALRLADHDEAREYLDRGIQTARSAVDESDKADSRYAERMLNLAAMHAKLYKETLDDDEFQKAKALWLSASYCHSARPVVRISSSLKAGQACFADSDFKNAYKVLTSAVELLPRISPRSISSADQQYLLSQGSGIAGFAAAAALQMDRAPYEALKCLEVGRCVISGLSMNLKDDVSELREAHSELYKRYDSLRQSFSRGPETATADYVSLARSLTQINDDLAGVEDEIRQQQGFENFRLPPSEEELKSLAAYGPIVVFNVVRYRSDAMIVTSQGITGLPLPNLKYEDLESKIGALERLGFSSRQRNAIPRRPAQTQNNIKSVLLWLWDVAVKPVLDTTKLTETRRIWWITNGLMALAPIHAAGDHSRGSQENTLSRAISSYISSFKALSYARRTRAPVLQPRKVLLVTMPSTPGHQSLDVRAETQIIQSSFGSRVTTKEQPTGAEVLSHMPHYSIVHFACHGYLSTLSPSDSGLIFAQGSKSEVLPISSIERISPSNAEIAFLSACSTAELSFGSHIDEAINLANCFQILGFRHVIGTIWSASDHSAGAVATKFYTRLADQISSATEELDVALALHEAIREYDGECEGDDGPLHWGPYIHVGT